MLNGFQAKSSRGETLELLLGDISQGYVIKSIDGLDPVKANVVSSSFANLDGEQYQSARREKRNIVIKLGMNGAFVVGGVRKLRARLYDFFLPKSQISLRFLSSASDEPSLDILGTIESLEAPLFAQDPEATISILCFDPDFYDAVPVAFSGVSNWDSTRQSVTYSGTVETGFIFRLNVNRTIANVGVYNIPPDGVERKMDIAAALVAGDVLEISTVPGAKRVTRIRGGVSTSILYNLSSFSDWIRLFSGVNQFRVAIEGAAIPYTLTYTTKYGGL